MLFVTKVDFHCCSIILKENTIKNCSFVLRGNFGCLHFFFFAILNIVDKNILVHVSLCSYALIENNTRSQIVGLYVMFICTLLHNANLYSCQPQISSYLLRSSSNFKIFVHLGCVMMSHCGFNFNFLD